MPRDQTVDLKEIRSVTEPADRPSFRQRAGFAIAFWTACMGICAPTARADPALNCTGAQPAGISSGVSAAMSAYMFTHPDVNDFITGLEAAGGDDSALQIAAYEASHPRERTEIANIRQPLADFDERCGYGTRGPAHVPQLIDR